MGWTRAELEERLYVQCKAEYDELPVEYVKDELSSLLTPDVMSATMNDPQLQQKVDIRFRAATDSYESRICNS